MKKSARSSAASSAAPRARGSVQKLAAKRAAGEKPTQAWFLYVLRCRDRTLYCGIAINVEKRLEQHRSGKGARYTRGRGPLELVHVWELANRSSALKAEWAFKRLSRAMKEKVLTKPEDWLASNAMARD